MNRKQMNYFVLHSPRGHMTESSTIGKGTYSMSIAPTPTLPITDIGLYLTLKVIYRCKTVSFPCSFPKSCLSGNISVRFSVLSVS